MPTDAVMTINERRKYLTLMQQRYLIATRQGRQPLLDEMELITGLRRRQRRPPGSIQAVAREIPMRRIAWDTPEPGLLGWT